MNIITTEQNKPDKIQLLRAQRVAYNQAKRVFTIEIITQVIALSAPIFFLINLSETSHSSVKYLSGGLSIITLILYLVSQSKTHLAVRIQEEFDTSLFGIEWNKIACGKKVDLAEIKKLANTYQKSDLFDWYSTEVGKIKERCMAVLVCQSINSNWDNTLRKTYIKYLLVFSVLYYTVLLIILRDLKLMEIVTVMSPTISFLIFIVLNYRNNLSILRRKQSLQDEITPLFEVYRNKRKQPSKKLIRQIQDAIFSERKRKEKIPDWFYRIYRGRQEKEMDEYVFDLIYKYTLDK